MSTLEAPGPKYALPSATGYEGHDPTLKRAPALTVAQGYNDKCKMRGPGPKYDCRNMSNRGKFFSQEAYLQGKPKFTYVRTPGAQNYGAHECPDLRHPRPPAWYFGAKTERSYKMAGPAPKYLVPEVTGKVVPDLPTAPAYTILGRDAIKLPKTFSPGPGKYPRVAVEVNLPRSPTPQVIGKPNIPTRYTQTIPAPKYKCDYNLKTEPPSYSFGVKHSMYETITYTNEDKKPFYGF